MLRGGLRWPWLCLLLGASRGGAGAADLPSGSESDADSWQPDPENWEWGSGSPLLQQLLHSFPADSPFIAESPGEPANCTQRFWLPPSSAVCWDNVVAPEEFARSRLMVLQNRAALQAVSASSGVGDGGASYGQQVREEVRGIQADHRNMSETLGTMQEVLLSLEETRKDSTVRTEERVFSSMKEQIASTKGDIDGREHLAIRLENQFNILEKSLLDMQHRLNKMMTH